MPPTRAVHPHGATRPPEPESSHAPKPQPEPAAQLDPHRNSAEMLRRVLKHMISFE